jgi:hypothetical protein
MLNPKHKILVKFDPHYPNLYDGTVQTFASLKINKHHDAWNDLEKTQKMNSI